MGQVQDRTEAAPQISMEQLQELDYNEQRAMLFYLTGYLEKSQEFQDALTRAYNAEMRCRARVAARRG
jgi:hypothetical protein